MPSFETSDHVSTRSVLRHRPIRTGAIPIGKRPIVTSDTIPVAQRASRPRVADTTDDVWHQGDEYAVDERYPSLHTQPDSRRALVVSSAGFPQSPRTRTGKIERETTVVLHHAHPLLYLGVGMLGMLVLWMVLSAAFGWFNTTLDDFIMGVLVRSRPMPG